MTTITTDDAKEVMKRLDAPCWQCEGAGRFPLGSSTTCDTCYGTGYQPTRAGVELLNFLRRQRKRIARKNI